ncbi:TOBE domain-containing protein [Cellulomonas oligotrophica]|uniref:MerR family transcriptional regulator n=1 Tax=Cellulomonas oligotrophica TaxID=931536 RepID=A0ABQ4D7H3_9CELL|nr:MerR family transcriptional regulator [Cellulomonas oligotrophica]
MPAATLTGVRYRVSEAATFLGVSDDTVRRWVEAGRLTAVRGASGRQEVEGADLARLATELADDPVPGRTSARNRMPGIVTRVVRDTVMAQVDVQAGPFRLVSLISREAADELALEPGVRVVAAVKATVVTVERPEPV